MTFKASFWWKVLVAVALWVAQARGKLDLRGPDKVCSCTSGGPVRTRNLIQCTIWAKLNFYIKIVIVSQDHNPTQNYKYEVRSFSVLSPLVLGADKAWKAHTVSKGLTRNQKRQSIKRVKMASKRLIRYQTAHKISENLMQNINERENLYLISPGFKQQMILTDVLNKKDHVYGKEDGNDIQ